MAESKSKSRSSSRSNSRKPREVVMEAVEQVQELIGRPVEAVTGMEKNGSDWTVTVEVVELSRIPNTTDVLGLYEVRIDERGTLQGYKRLRRYARGAPGEE